jgi:hypothetical protein
MQEHADINNLPCPFRLTSFRFRIEVRDISSDEMVFHFLLVFEQGESSGFISWE